MPSWWRIQGGCYVAHSVLFVVNKKGDACSALDRRKRRRVMDTLESGYAACTAILVIGKTSVDGQTLDLSYHKKIKQEALPGKTVVPWVRVHLMG